MGSKVRSGAYIIETFTESETWATPPGVTKVDYCVVGAGGGAGGYVSGSASAGGGGGGEVLQGTDLAVSGDVTVTIGAGGDTSPTENPAQAGGDTTFGSVTANGGNGGYRYGHGGASGDGHTGGAYNPTYTCGGGGGGDDANGSNAGSSGGKGGDGTQCSIDSTYYGGGGCGGGGTAPAVSQGGGNAGGGGEYAGGARTHDGYNGIVIIKYLAPSKLFTFNG